MGELRTLHEDDTLYLAMEDNVAVAVWSDAPTVEQLRTMEAGLQTLRKEAPEGGAFMNVVVAGTPRFSNEVREEAARITRETQPTDRGTAHVVLIGGLAGSAVRAFIGTMTLLGRPAIPTKTFGDLRSATAWLAARLEGTPGPEWTPAMLTDLAERVVATRKA